MSFQTTYGPDGRLRVAILGCTGSIGTQALDVCRQHADRLQVTALSVNSSTSELVAAAREFSVPAVAVADVAHGDDAVLQELPEGTQLGVGAQAVCELARRDDVDCVLVAIVGAAGLEASHAALTSNKRLALANKESLVVGGDLLMPLAQPGQLIPVDSEHSAIYQCYLGENPREAHCIWLTCSGGPFFGRTRDELDRVTRADALAHPTWAMGAKITIDSATLMNKGLERIEAMHLFNCDLDFINVVVQRQSKIHSMVEFADGSVMAHLGASDMRIPIQFAFSYPERWDTPAPRIDFRELGQLTFDAATWIPSAVWHWPSVPARRVAPCRACSMPPTRSPSMPSCTMAAALPISIALWNPAWTPTICRWSIRLSCFATSMRGRVKRLRRCSPQPVPNP